MRLEELLESDLSEGDFHAKHDQPALLIEPLDGPPTKAADETLDAPGTEVLSASRIQKEMARGADFLNPETQVAWLRKSDRNPFANLITIGRVSSNDVVIVHSSVSKVHATFSKVDDQWFVQDGRSRNGTFVNGVRLEAGEKTSVGDGDKVDLGGEVSIRFLSPRSLWEFLRKLEK